MNIVLLATFIDTQPLSSTAPLSPYTSTSYANLSKKIHPWLVKAFGCPAFLCFLAFFFDLNGSLRPWLVKGWGCPNGVANGVYLV